MINLLEYSWTPPLKPCPFCGGEAYAEACDRLINIGCRRCNYHLYFHGIVQSDHVTDVVATYGKNTGEPIEWYDKDADVKAIAKWNTRASEVVNEQ